MSLPETTATAVAAVVQLSHTILDHVRIESPEAYAVANALMERGAHIEVHFALAPEAPAAALVLRKADGQVHDIATVPLKVGEAGRH